MATPLTQAILQGLDPGTYRALSDIDQGNALQQVGMDASPTSKWGAIGRLANAAAGTYLSSSATSDLAKTIAGGKKSAQDQLLAAIEAQSAAARPAAVPMAAPAQAAPIARPTPLPAPTPAATAPAMPQAAPPQPAVPAAAGPYDPATFKAQADQLAARTNEPTVPLDAPAPGALAAAAPAAGAAPDGVAAIDAMLAGGKAPRGVRNNNPLNIEDGPFAKSQTGYAGSDGRFAKFGAPEHGIAAASSLLDSYDTKHGLNTVAGIVNRWAPPSDGNNTTAYAADVAGKLGIDPNAPVPKELRPQLIAAMASHENGVPFKVAQAAPQTMTDATSAEAPAAAAKAGGFDAHKLLAVLQNPYTDDNTKTLVSKLLLQQLTPKEDEFASSPQGIFNKTTGELKKPDGGSSADYGGLQGKDLLAAVQKSDPRTASQVTAIIEGRAPYPTGSRLNPVQQQVKELVTQVDPTFEVGNSGARIKVRNEFNAGGPNSPAGAITAGNTAIQHLGHLSDEAEKLGNFDSGIPGNNLVNEAKNAISRSAGGGIAASNFDSIRNKYIEEATKFYRGTGGTESDLQRDIASLNSAQSPSQLRDVIKTQAGLMQSKVNALQERWKHGMGPMVEDFPIIHPESQGALERINNRQAGKAEAVGASSATAPAAAPAAPKAVSSKSEYDALPSGSSYVAPDGSVRTKK